MFDRYDIAAIVTAMNVIEASLELQLDNNIHQSTSQAIINK